MPGLFLYNTLGRKKEKFVPNSPPEVKMYTCGPTVHDYIHIGNLRAFVFYDTLKRVLVFNGFKVKHVMNITDVDDKIIKKANEAGLTIYGFTKKYEKAFFENMKRLNVIPADKYPKATEYTAAMISLIQKLLDKEVAYKAEDGSIYFSIEKFPKYGTLSQLDKREVKVGARIAADEYTKENAQDFALWKAEKPGEPSWDTPFGKGRPGWHIECSAMSMDILGETLDIHTGGVDLLFPHHEDEIAQSEAATGKQFSKYWVHNAHLLVEGQKMSKSLHNFYTLKDIENKGYDPLALRYLYLTAHYRDPLNFTWEALLGAQNALNKLRAQVSEARSGKRTILSPEKHEKVEKARSAFVEAINDDLNTPRALAALWEMLKSNIPSPDKYDLVMSFDEVLGLQLNKVPEIAEVPQEVKDLVDKREKLRMEGKFEEADKIRIKVEALGYEIEDSSEGPKVKRLPKWEKS